MEVGEEGEDGEEGEEEVDGDDDDSSWSTTKVVAFDSNDNEASVCLEDEMQSVLLLLLLPQCPFSLELLLLLDNGAHDDNDDDDDSDDNDCDSSLEELEPQAEVMGADDVGKSLLGNADDEEVDFESFGVGNKDAGGCGDKSPKAKLDGCLCM